VKLVVEFILVGYHVCVCDKSITLKLNIGTRMSFGECGQNSLRLFETPVTFRTASNDSVAWLVKSDTEKEFYNVQSTIQRVLRERVKDM
jgi:hypothetical protein